MSQLIFNVYESTMNKIIWFHISVAKSSNNDFFFHVCIIPMSVL